MIVSGTAAMAMGDNAPPQFVTGLTALHVSITDHHGASGPGEKYFGDVRSAVGGKYFLDRKTAVEGEVTLVFGNEEKSENQEEGVMMGISGAYIQYIDVDRVSPYLKYGGRFAYLMGDAYEDNEDDDHFFLEARAGFGTEYFITPELSIGAEALIGLQVAPTVVFNGLIPSIRISFYFDDFVQ